MSNPAYLWFIDENGSPIVGGSMVLGREGSIEVKSLSHHLTIPTDRNTGKLTGTRIHIPILIQKEFDRTTPLLARAICRGVTLKSAEIKMYRTNEAGFEVEYFNMLLENVKVTGFTPGLHPGVASGTHLENIEMHYETIQWKYTDGNIIFKDGWNERATA
ncbi:type VI secretion system tube protein Hcp [Raoultella terrigena]|uniref:Hcp family type VI secretion system effector n=1 Tax=Raoultella terrigena TaxID=577 RepID=UPI002DB73E31|nr:type VI secretion system tube protein TssD [Raoultella terrigena]MEB8195639.1 type VI secretion system tube protein Hcp [Raoultella terrigena]